MRGKQRGYHASLNLAHRVYNKTPVHDFFIVSSYATNNSLEHISLQTDMNWIHQLAAQTLRHVPSVTRRRTVLGLVGAAALLSALPLLSHIRSQYVSTIDFDGFAALTHISRRRTKRLLDVEKADDLEVGVSVPTDQEEEASTCAHTSSTTIHAETAPGNLLIDQAEAGVIIPLESTTCASTISHNEDEGGENVSSTTTTHGGEAVGDLIKFSQIVGEEVIPFTACAFLPFSETQRLPVKKALLIAIMYREDDGEWGSLPNLGSEVRKLRDLLIRECSFPFDVIVVY